jgi:hypothetical protein
MTSLMVIKTPLSVLIGSINDGDKKLAVEKKLTFTVSKTAKSNTGRVTAMKDVAIEVVYERSLRSFDRTYHMYRTGDLNDITIRAIHDYFKAHEWSCWYREIV